MKGKVKKIRKLNLKRFFIFLIILSLLITSYIYLSKLPIKNIIIKNNYYITDNEVINLSNIKTYPSFIKTSSYKIKKNLLTNPLIKDVKVHKSFGRILTIEIEEYKVLFKIRSTEEFVLSTNKRLNDLELNSPILINYVSEDILEKFINKLENIDIDLINKISEIEYSPTTYDKERFIFYMSDQNTLYITINKLKNFNKYNIIKEQLGTKKGILYLDSGNYFEEKN